MTTKCPHCDFQKEAHLPRDILKRMGEDDLPAEDYLLMMSQLIQAIGVSDVHSIKTHIGIVHKGMSNFFNVIEFDEEERRLISLHGRAQKEAQQIMHGI